MPLSGRDADHLRVRAAESRLEYGLAWLMSLLVFGTLFYVYVLFQPLVPAPRLNLWAGFTLVVSLVMLLVPLAFYWARPDDIAIDRVWSPLGRLVAILFDLAVASSVWLLLPFASEPLRLLMVIFYSAAISGQVISTAESTGTILFGVVTIIGSAALFFFLNETRYAVPLGLFLVGYGGLMILVALILKRAIRAAIALRIKAEQISADLEKALAAAQAEREARTRFIAAVSHDLRQPLQAASLFAHSAARAPAADDRAPAIAGVQRGLAEANSLLENMTQHLLVESGAVTARRERVPLAPLLASLEQELRPLALRGQIDLRCRVARDAAAMADPALVSRIVRNLVHNAITHAQCGRIRILARLVGAAQICVIDDGVGIDLSQQQSYLAPYSQGPEARRASGGSGLGLAIAAELAQLMAGDIALLPSPAGSGLHVRITLPGATAAAATTTSQPLPPGVLLKGRRMLVIDDHPDALVAVAQWCRLQGASAVVAASGAADARARLTAGLDADLVLTDWHIGAPGAGAALVAHVRAALPGAAIIVMTGDAQPATQSDIAALGLPVMLKPVDADKLASALRALAPGGARPSSYP